jgi:capsular exopolysaccharide synthesis family protein
MGGSLARREFYETQYQLILGRDLLERTFEKFEMGGRKEFREEMDPVKEFRKRFKVTPVRRSRLVKVSFDWKDPEVAARVVDFQVDGYITDYRNRTFGVTTSGLTSLREKADELRPKVEAKSREVQRFLASADMVSLEKTENIIIERLQGLNQSLTEMEKKRIEYESVYNSIRQTIEEDRPIDDVPEVALNQAIRDLKLEYVRARQDLSELAKRFGPNHPEVKNTVARLKTTRDKLVQEMQSTLASAKANFDRSVVQEREMRAELEAQEERVMQLNKQSARYVLMTDSYDTLKKTYNALIQRIEEIEVTMAAGSRDDNIFVVNRPRVPVEPVWPKKGLLFSAACVAGLTLGMTLCFFLDYLDTTVKTKEDVERILAVPLIGYIPTLKGRAISRKYRRTRKPVELMPVQMGRSPLAEAFRSIRTAMVFSAVNGEFKCVQVVSSVPQEGKTLTSVNLAVAVARAGKRVLLIDADLRKPRVHKVFEVPMNPGLTDVLAGEGNLETKDVIREFREIPTLHYLPSGVIPPNPAELLASDRMKSVVAKLKTEYDQIIFDTPPSTIVTDGVIVSGLAQGTIVVVRAFSTQAHMLEQTREVLSQAKAKIIGAVLNNVDMPKRGYYYSAYYYKKSGYYGAGSDEEFTGKAKVSSLMS